jgi:arsenate reductase
MAIAFMNLKKRPPAPGELRRFAQKHGARALLDEDSKAYHKANRGYLSMGDAEVLDRSAAVPGLLRLPLVRLGHEVSLGVDEVTWMAWQKDSG